MKLHKSIFPFIVITILDLAARLNHMDELVGITKPLLMPALIFYFFKSAPTTPLNKFVFAALFFSFLGDVLLMLVPRSETFFLAGLISFLIAHLLYIIINMNAVTTEDRSIKPQWSDLIFVVYGFAIFSVINETLGDMYIPALIYTVVVCMMAVTARKRWTKTDKQSFWLVMTGAAFFLISDSILAYSKFNENFASADFFIMTTYVLAQFLIVQGLIVFIQKIRPGAGS
ncbi:lysoplasmalogenase [Roseivirga sp. E12]|uniref:lysoplasmalogenase n=1 Tax=Roseivirga sp. E12 TaxID=2819237 RepID=UPI001ABC952D|nr:lysoplasmalogenase [Roseivirga sp. E12]MBO3700010.1 lysoplasmalogenase [Roseivirga sp. E12]